jgi:lantibiotic biosynthesis dehydratase-like protein
MAVSEAELQRTRRAGTDAAGHLIRTTPDGWGWWKPLVLRAPGFPAAGVLRLASPELGRAADEVRDAAPHEGDAAWSPFRRTYDATLLELGRTLRDIATSPRFREAVAWQNHRALETAVAPLLRWEPGKGRDRKHRGHEELIASYWQRYCVKNDSIGFFGPVAWGSLDATRDETRLAVGDRLTKSCGVYFESWAIDALADVLGDDPALRPWLVPRRMPYVRVEDGAVLLPGEESVSLTQAEAAVLRACDGRARACDVAEAVARPPLALVPEDVYALLDSFRRRRWVVWTLEVPVAAWQDRALRDVLGRIDDESVRDAAFAKLDELDAARRRVCRAAGDPERVRAALADLDEVFSRLTGSRPFRHEGKTYAGRTIVYSDCRRDATLELGADFVDALEPLQLVLHSARWLTFEAARALHDAFLDTYRALARRTARPVRLSTFWFECMSILHGDAVPVVDGIQAEFQRRWERALACPLEPAEVRYSGDEVAKEMAIFEAPYSGWAGARYCSPDVLIAAEDLEAVRRGDFDLVLGELHVAINALRHACFVAQHPDPAELRRCLEADFPEPRLLPVLPKESPPRLTTRLHPALARADDYHVALVHQTVDVHRQRVVMSGDVVVEDCGGRLVVSFDGGRKFSVMDVFAEILMGLVLDRFRIFPPAPHTPRVYFDRLVVARESWVFDPTDLDFAAGRDEPRRFVAARAWRDEAALPRHVFVKSPLEQKPFYVDFDSPIFVNILAKAIRRLEREARDGVGRELKVVEMLPTLEQLWLHDGDGNRYTSEIRLVGVDLRDGPQAFAA